MDLHAYLRAIRRSWWVVVVSAVLGGGLATVVMLNITPVYASQVTFFATTPNAGSDNPLQGDQFGQQRVNTYVKLLGSERLADQIIASTSVDLTAPRVMRKIEGKADLNTVLFTATIRDSSPERSLLLAKAVAREFPRLVDQIESVGGAKQAPVNLDVVSGPSLNPYPVSPKKKLGVAVGLLAGILLGIALALLRTLTDRSFRNAEDLSKLTGVPVLGTIPFDPDAKKSPLANLKGRSVRSEAFRALRTNLQFVDVEEPVAVLVVTSSTAHEGKSSTSANIALTFAEAGQKVLLIEADLRRPKLAEYLGLEGAVGLTNILAGQVKSDDVIQSWGSTGLKVLGSGSIPPNPSELLGSQAMVDLIAELKKQFDLIVIDTPPLLPVTDAVIAATAADGALVVVRYGKTLRAEVDRAVGSLKAVDARVLGTILNRVPSRGVDAHRYERYEYSQESLEESPKKKGRG